MGCTDRGTEGPTLTIQELETRIPQWQQKIISLQSDLVRMEERLLKLRLTKEQKKKEAAYALLTPFISRAIRDDRNSGLIRTCDHMANMIFEEVWPALKDGWRNE